MSSRHPGPGCRSPGRARAWSSRSRCTIRVRRPRAARSSRRSSAPSARCPTRASRSMSPSPARASRTRSTSGSQRTRSRSTSGRDGALDVEAEGAELLAPALGDALRAPRRQPHPVDAEVGHEPLERLSGLILDHVGERARRAGQGHVDGRHPLGVDVDAVDQAEVHHVDAELGVHHVTQGLEHLLLLSRELGDELAVRLRHPVLDRRVLGRRVVSGRVLRHRSSSRALAVASFHAIQPSNAHLILAGYLDTPANATASSSTPSSGVPSPLDCMSPRNAWLSVMASVTGLPMTRSLMTAVLAWLIEQPSVSYEMSSITGSPSTSLSVTRRVTSSPQTGLT